MAPQTPVITSQAYPLTTVAKNWDSKSNTLTVDHENGGPSKHFSFQNAPVETKLVSRRSATFQLSNILKSMNLTLDAEELMKVEVRHRFLSAMKACYWNQVCLNGAHITYKLRFVFFLLLPALFLCFCCSVCFHA